MEIVLGHLFGSVVILIILVASLLGVVWYKVVSPQKNKERVWEHPIFDYLDLECLRHRQSGDMLTLSYLETFQMSLHEFMSKSEVRGKTAENWLNLVQTEITLPFTSRFLSIGRMHGISEESMGGFLDHCEPCINILDQYAYEESRSAAFSSNLQRTHILLTVIQIYLQTITMRNSDEVTEDGQQV